MAQTDLSIFIFGLVCLELIPPALDHVHLNSSLPVQSTTWLELATFALDSLHLEFLSPLRSFGYLEPASSVFKSTRFESITLLLDGVLLDSVLPLQSLS